jgi:hypothetical protein
LGCCCLIIRYGYVKGLAVDFCAAVVTRGDVKPVFRCDRPTLSAFEARVARSVTGRAYVFGAFILTYDIGADSRGGGSGRGRDGTGYALAIASERERAFAVVVRQTGYDSCVVAFKPHGTDARVFALACDKGGLTGG